MGILDLFRGSPLARIARRVIAEMRALGESRRLELVEAEARIVAFNADGSPAAFWNLANLQVELDHAPEDEHDEIYRRWARGFRSTDAEEKKPYAEVRPALRIVLKDATYPAFIDLLHRTDHGAAEGNPIVWRQLVADVVACAVEEQEDTLRFIAASDLAHWQVSAEQVLDDAFANTRALPVEISKGEVTHFVSADDAFIASRLVCEAAFRDLELNGAPVAVIPDRDTLFVVGSEDERGLFALARLNANQFEEGARIISGRPLVLTEHGWREFRPPESSRIEFENVARRFHAYAWRDYQELLERDLAAREEDIHVASLDVYRRDDEPETFSSVTWSRDVDTILPRADRVSFFDSVDESIRFASWEDVRRVMKHAMQPMEGAPERYRIDAFPTPEEFLQMGAKLL